MIRLSIFGLKLFYIRLLTSLMFSELHFGLGIWAVLALILQLNYFYEDFWIHKRLNTSSEKNPSVKALIEQVASFKLQLEIGSLTHYYVKITFSDQKLYMTFFDLKIRPTSFFCHILGEWVKYEVSYYWTLTLKR